MLKDIKLLDFQDKFIKSNERIKILAHERRVGGTFAALNDVYNSTKPEIWIGTHSLNSIDKNIATELQEKARFIAPDVHSMRGLSGNVTIDDPALCDWGKIWPVVKCIVSATIKNQHGYNLRLIGRMSAKILTDVQESNIAPFFLFVECIRLQLNHPFPIEEFPGNEYGKYCMDNNCLYGSANNLTTFIQFLKNRDELKKLGSISRS